MKIIKIVIINIVVLFLFLIPIEFYYVSKWQHGYNSNDFKFKDYVKSIFIKKNFDINFNNYKNSIFHSISVNKYFDMLYANKIINGAFTTNLRPDENINSDKKSVIFMGCSFTWSDGLNEDETVSAQFAKLTGKPTYNRAGRGWGLSHFLYQVRRNDFYTQFKEEPEYIFYIYIQDHDNRLDKFKIEPNCIDFQPKYIIKKGHLIEQKPNFIDRLYSVQDYQYYYNYNKKKVDFSTIKLYFTEARDAIRQHWKNTKLVILVYPIRMSIDKNLFTTLENEGYKVIYLEDLVNIDLTDDKYRCDGWHPSAEAWQIILPKIIKELDIK